MFLGRQQSKEGYEKLAGAVDEGDQQNVIEELKLEEPEDETQKGLSCFSATMFVIGDVIGAGVIALPFAVKLASWYGIPMLIMSALVMAKCAILLAKACNVIMKDRTNNEDLRDPYPFLAEKAAGKAARYCVTITLNVALASGCIVFLLLAGEILSKLIPLATEGISYRNELRIWFVICGTVMLPLTFLGTPKDFWGIAVMATVTSILAAILILTNLGIINHSHDIVVTHPHPSAENIFAAFGTFLFAFGGVSVFPTIQNDMHRPDKFQNVLSLGYTVVFVVYLVVPLASYGILGGLIKEDLLTTLTELSLFRKVMAYKIFVIISQVLICGHVLCAFVMNMNPVYQQIEGYFEIPTGFCWQRVVIRSIAMSLVVGFAIVVPNFGPLLSLVGGTIQVLIGIIFPIWFYAKLTDAVSLAEEILFGFIIVLAVVGGCGNGIVEIKNVANVIVGKYSSAM